MNANLTPEEVDAIAAAEADAQARARAATADDAEERTNEDAEAGAPVSAFRVQPADQIWPTADPADRVLHAAIVALHLAARRIAEEGGDDP